MRSGSQNIQTVNPFTVEENGAAAGLKTDNFYPLIISSQYFGEA